MFYLIKVVVNLQSSIEIHSYKACVQPNLISKSMKQETVKYSKYESHFLQIIFTL